MITYNNLFEKLCSLENLYLAFRKARRGKTKKWYVREFESNLEKELTNLKSELETQNYQPRPFKRFVVRDPKTRVIYASAFRDRVVHHTICNLIKPIFENGIKDFCEVSRESNSENLEKFLQGWLGYAVHGNTYNLRKRIMRKHLNFFDSSE